MEMIQLLIPITIALITGSIGIYLFVIAYKKYEYYLHHEVTRQYNLIASFTWGGSMAALFFFGILVMSFFDPSYMLSWKALIAQIIFSLIMGGVTTILTFIRMSTLKC